MFSASRLTDSNSTVDRYLSPKLGKTACTISKRNRNSEKRTIHSVAQVKNRTKHENTYSQKLRYHVFLFTSNQFHRWSSIHKQSSIGLKIPHSTPIRSNFGLRIYLDFVHTIILP